LSVDAGNNNRSWINETRECASSVIKSIKIRGWFREELRPLEVNHGAGGTGGCTCQNSRGGAEHEKERGRENNEGSQLDARK